MNRMHNTLIRRDEVVRQVLLLRNRVDEMADTLAPIDETAEPPSPEELYLTIEGIIALRRQRVRVFGANLFGEPAWDMLLELFRDEMIGKFESVSSLCFASGVPATTALRWVKALERDGWIRRSADASDGRRYYLSLTQRSKEAFNNLFAREKSWNKRAKETEIK